MKYTNVHFFQFPRILWPVSYEQKYDKKTGKNTYTTDDDDKYLPYHKLSVNAKWLYVTLKECEHRYTGKNNDADTVLFE